MRLEDLTGKKFGLLTVVERSSGPNKKHTYWLCECECGTQRVVAAAHLKSGHTKSCGCLTSSKKDSFTVHRLKKIFQGMKKRCYNHNTPGYMYYGVRGIQICDEWLHDFQAFYEWAMANGYEDHLTIDRINVNGNYEPSNCRWATKLEQSNNTRANVFISYNGKTQTISEWARELNIHVHTLENRLYRGWTIEDAFTKPARRYKRKKNKS